MSTIQFKKPRMSPTFVASNLVLQTKKKKKNCIEHFNSIRLTISYKSSKSQI